MFCISACLSACKSVCLSVLISVCLFVCLYVCLSVCFFVCILFVCLYICLFVCPYICLFVCLSFKNYKMLRDWGRTKRCNLCYWPPLSIASFVALNCHLLPIFSNPVASILMTSIWFLERYSFQGIYSIICDATTYIVWQQSISKIWKHQN